MSRYRKVSVAVWSDRFVRSLSDDAKLTWMYLLTSPQTTPFGCYSLSIDQSSCDLAWPVDRYRNAMREIVSKGGDLTIRYDHVRGLVFLPNWLAYNQPNNTNVVVGWARQIAELPEDSPLIYDLLCAIEEHMRDKGFQKTFWNTYGKTFRTQEQEQEQDRGRGRPRAKKPPPMRFNYETGKWNRHPTKAETALWEKAYPDVNINRELIKATAWLSANADHPKKRFPAFLNNWMARAQRGWDK